MAKQSLKKWTENWNNGYNEKSLSKFKESYNYRPRKELTISDDEINDIANKIDNKKANVETD